MFEPLPRLKPQAELMTLFAGHVVSRESVGPSDQRLARSKQVAIAPGAYISPHVVDLKPVLETTRLAGESRERHHDFEQRLAILTDRLWRTVAPTYRDEYRHLTLERGPRQKTSVPPPITGARPTAPRFAPSMAVAAVDPANLLPRQTHSAPLAKPVATVRSVAAPVPKIHVAPTIPVMKKEKAIRTAPPLRLRFALPTAWKRSILVFACLALAVIFPIHLSATFSGLAGGAETVLAKTQGAFDNLKSAGDAAMVRDGSSAARDFEQAAASFAATQSRLRGATVSLGALLTGNADKLKDGKRLLSAGESLSRAGALVSQAFASLGDEKDVPLTHRVETLADALANALPDIHSAVAELNAVDITTIPKDYRPAFETARGDIASVTADLERFTASSDSILGLLGAEGKRRYLVVFQNDRELRPTGGFIGSFALMDVEDGEIMSMEIPAGGSYDMRGGLNERIAAPDQLRLVNPRWEFQDANWFADFPASADALSWFYEKSGGPTVDGVIAVTTGFMEDLLTTLGPIEMAEYGKTLTADNFFIETQKAVELEYDREANRPKQFIADLAPKALEKLVTEGGADLPMLMDAVSRALATKDIQMHFKDDGEQAVAGEFGWTGALKPVPGADYLAVVDANIAGGKTDGVVHADIRHESEIQADGAIINTVSVTRTHRGARGDLFTGVKNIDYIRFYVPNGSQLLEAEGFEKPGEGYFLTGDALKPSSLLAAVEGAADEGAGGTRVTSESGMTVFGNWVQVEPGEKRTVRIRYRLPFTVVDLVKRPETRFERLKDSLGAFVRMADLKLVVQKQAGARNRTFSTSIRLPSGWRIRSRLPETAGVGAGRLTLTTPLERDLYIGLLVSNDL